MSITRTAIVLALALSALNVSLVEAASKKRKRTTDTPLNLDFTKGDKPGIEHGYNLGPTGLHGWISAKKKVGSSHARQIYIMSVASGSPAADLFHKGDVILGVNKQNFSSDARIAFARAITEAEKNENQGVLQIRRWRNGVTEDVKITLPVMGSYDPKTLKSEKIKRLTELAINSLTKQGIGKGGIPAHVNALALMATGDKKHLPLVKAHVSGIKAPSTAKLKAWNNAYACLLLTEYCLYTEDKSVLPKVREFALSLAGGQNLCGTWGHSYARPDGILGGYGAMNQVALPAGMALALADKCGIGEPSVTHAAKRTHDYFRWYTGKGAVPYGDHRPIVGGHCSNGKSAGCAVLMNIMQDREGAAFFGKMATLATANSRESGHTGHFFNTLWGPLGANVIGSEALAAQCSELSWLFDLERTLTGASVYNPTPGDFGGHMKYRGWDSTGARLLAYVADRRCIHITGKQTCVKPVTGKDLEQLLTVGQMKLDGLSEAKLLTLLSSWSPAIRNNAAKRLAEGKVDEKILLGMLSDKSIETRSGACQVFAELGHTMSDQAVDELIRLLEDEDVGVRRYAVMALGASRNAKGVPALLQGALRTDTKSDPREHLLREISMSLFTHKSLKNHPSYMRDARKYLDSADRKLLIPALRRMLMSSGGHARCATMTFCQDLQWQDHEQLLPELMHNAAYKAPGCVMFGGRAKVGALKVLSGHGVKQVLDVSMKSFLLDPIPGGGAQHFSQSPGLEALMLFGSDAREFLPMLDKLRTKIKGEPERFQVHTVIPPLIRKTEQALQQDKGHPTLREIEPKIVVPGMDQVIGVPER